MRVCIKYNWHSKTETNKFEIFEWIYKLMSLINKYDYRLHD